VRRPGVTLPVIPREAAPLGRTDRLRLAVEIVGSYARVRWWLVRTDVPHTVVAARRYPCGVPATGLSPAAALRLGHAVQRLLGLLPLDSRCLVRSLVLTRLLARRGMPSTLVLAARSKPSFAAHAWVEHDGVALLPTGTDYHRLTEM
jgi:hypothetical protein